MIANSTMQVWQDDIQAETFSFDLQGNEVFHHTIRVGGSSQDLVLTLEQISALISYLSAVEQDALCRKDEEFPRKVNLRAMIRREKDRPEFLEPYK